MKRKATTMSTTDTTEISREIKYSRATRDYDCYVNGQYVGSARNYSEGEALCDEIVYNMIADETCLTAAQLDGGSDADACAVDAAALVIRAAEPVQQAATVAEPVAVVCATCAGEGDCPDCDSLIGCEVITCTQPATHFSASGAMSALCCACFVTAFGEPCGCASVAIDATALLEEADAVIGRLYCPNCLGNHLLQDCPLKRGDHTTEADTLLNQLANHPGPNCYCPDCMRAAERLIVDAYITRLQVDAGLICQFCGDDHADTTCPPAGPAAGAACL
jgi:hypothetical protein